MQLLTDVHLPLLDLVVAEAFEAAIDVAGQENLDIRQHEMRYAMPPLKVREDTFDQVSAPFCSAPQAGVGLHAMGHAILFYNVSGKYQCIAAVVQ